MPSKRQPRFVSSQHRNHDSENVKNDLETSLNKNESQNHFKIDENPVPDHLVSMLLLPWSSRGVPRCQNGRPGCSRGIKMVSKWKHGAPQMTTPRSQKGPAAEGVALKVCLNSLKKFLEGIDTISPTFNFMLLIDIEPTFKTFRTLLNGSSGLSGPRRFPSFQNETMSNIL